jgi:hypothetical protein
MRTALRMLMVPAVVVMAVTVGCSSNGGGGTEDQGKPPGEVCGAFAKDAPSSAALAAIAGKGNLTNRLSEPDEVLKALREAARTEQQGKERMKGIPFCWLQRAKDGKPVLHVTFREALALPSRDAADEAVATFFSTGELASSSVAFAPVYFKCRMKAPAHEILIAAELERSDENKAPEKDIRTNQMTVVNAAARKVAADLGCQNDTKLVTGQPRPAVS